MVITIKLTGETQNGMRECEITYHAPDGTEHNLTPDLPQDVALTWFDIIRAIRILGFEEKQRA